MAPIMDRIWDRTITIPECGCYVWQGALSDGYGRINIAGQPRRVHRVAYEELVGPIPKGLTLDHLCRVRSCWRPEHLEPVTHRENILRGHVGKANSYLTHCKRGHPFSPENTHITKHGHRVCRACRNYHQASYRRYGYGRS